MIKTNKKETDDLIKFKEKKIKSLLSRSPPRSTSKPVLSTYDFVPTCRSNSKKDNFSNFQILKKRLEEEPTPSTTLFLKKSQYSLEDDLKILKAEKHYETSDKYTSINKLLDDLKLSLNKSLSSLQKRRGKLMSLSYLQIKVLVEYANHFKGLAKERKVIFYQKGDIFVEKINGDRLPENEHNFMLSKITIFAEESETSDLDDNLMLKFAEGNNSEPAKNLQKGDYLKKEDDYFLLKSFLDYQKNYISKEDIYIDIFAGNLQYGQKELKNINNNNFYVQKRKKKVKRVHKKKLKNFY